MSEENNIKELTYYSESIFIKRSIFLGVILSLFVFWLNDAIGWQSWVITATACIFCIAISIQQATVIENIVMLFLLLLLLVAISFTDFFSFHWSVLVSGIFGALNGMVSREARNQHQYRTAYGDKAYLEKYGKGKS